MKNKLIFISSTTPIFGSIIVYLVSLLFLLISFNSITTDIVSFVFMGMLGVFLLLVGLSLFYFKLLSVIRYERLKLEAYVSMSEKNKELTDYLVGQEYQLKQQDTKYVFEKGSTFSLFSFIIYIILGILPALIYLIVVLEEGSHTISFELGGKVYEEVTVDMNNNKLIFGSK